MSEQSHGKVEIEALADAPILLPDDPGYLTAEYVRDGDDLVIETPSGEVTVVTGYFSLDAPVDLIVAGAAISGKVVGALARPRPEAAQTDAADGYADASADAAPSAGAHAAEAGSIEIGQPIGKIGEISGEAFAKRADGSVVSLKAGDPVYEDDLLSTGDGAALGVVFADGMTFSLGAQARMVLDEFRYDEAAHEGGGLFSVLAGEFSFVSGAAAHTAEDALMIETPTMTIGVRGTKVVSQIDADGVSRIALLAEEDGTVGKIMVMTDAGEQLIDSPNKMVEIADRSQPPSAQMDITAAEVVRFFGEAVEALPAPYEFFEPKANAPHVAPAAPFAANRQASAEAEKEAVAAEAAIAEAEAQTSFADRAEQIAQQSSSSAAPEAPAADFTVVARSLQRLAEEIAAEEPEAFIAAVEQQTSASEAVEAALTAARETAESFAEASVEQAEEVIEIETAAAAERETADPAALSVSVDEDVADTAVIHDMGGTAAFYALADDHGGLFEIDVASGQISLAAGRSLDFESQSSYSLTVRATEVDGNVSTQSIDLTVGDVNDTAPVFMAGSPASATVSEAAGDGETLHSAAATDADTTGESLTYQISEDASGLFEVDPATGAVSLKSGASLDFETAQSHSISILATDGVNSAVQVVNIAVTDANEFSVSAISDANGEADGVTENASDGTIVGVTAFASDGDGSTNTVSYSLSDDAGGRFTIDAATGVVSVADGSLLDYETATSHDIEVAATSADGSTSAKTFTIALQNANEFSVTAPSDDNPEANSVSEGAVDGAAVGVTAAASDGDAVDNAVTYSLSDDAGGRFAIDPDTGIVTVADASLIDYETAQSHTIEVTATSADGSTNATSFTIAVTDINDVGQVFTSAASASAAEGVGDSAVLYTAVATDADTTGEAVTFRLTADPSGLFEIDANSGEVTLRSGAALDHEAAQSHSITIESTDGTHSSTKTVTISVQDIAEAIQLANGGATYTEAGSAEISVTGGDGDDVITGGDGGDTLHGGGGDDQLNGGNAVDALYGGTGADTLSGANGNDMLTGGAGDDVIDGGNGQDTAVFSGNYADYTISYDTDARSFTVNGPDGVDTVTNVSNFQFDDQTVSDDTIISDIADATAPQTLTGAGGDDTLTGGHGHDTITGDWGNDTISGLAGDDNIDGGNNDDVITGGLGDDTIEGGTGTDTAIFAGNFADYSFAYDGGTGTLTVDGPDGTDSLTNVENLQFDDQTVAVSTVVSSISGNTNPTITLAGAVDFDGSDDYVDMGDQAALDVGTGDLTVEAWFYYDGSASGDQTIVSKGNEGDANIGYSIRIIDDELVLRLNADDTGDDSGTAAVSQNLGEAGWYHVAMVVDQTSGSLKGYLNGSDAGFAAGHAGSGVADNSFTAPGGGVDATESFMLGANDEGGGAGEFFDGQISDVRVWSTARSAAEIADGMNKVMDGTETGLVAQWAPEAGDASLVDTVGSLVGSLLGGANSVDPNTVTLGGDGTVTGRLALSDADGDAMTIVDGAGPSKGSVEIDYDTGVWTYTVADDDNTTDSFSYQVADAYGGVDTISITVNL